MVLDTNYAVEIPGGIDLQAEVVGPAPRALAFAIDFVIRTLMMIGLLFAAVPFGTVGFGFWMIAWFVIEWFYPVLFEVFWRGQTPGKRAMKISVVADDLTPVSFGASLVRNLLRTADFLPFCYALGLVAMVCNRRFQRLGDMAAGTLVISLRETTRPSATTDIEPLSPPIELLRSEQIALIDFLQRSAQISEDRQRELASILEGATYNSPDDGVKATQRIGAWFLGLR